MASTIDGSTYRKYWKLTPDNTAPNIFELFPKDSVRFRSAGAASGAIVRTQDAADATLIATDADTIDESGNALNTSAKVANYLNQNK